MAGVAETIYDDDLKHGATLVFRSGDTVSRGYYPCEMMMTKEHESQGIEENEPDGKSIDWLLANGYIECPICGKLFEKKIHNQKYCSTECRRARWRKGI